MPKTTPADVVECYRIFLGRAPESEEVISSHLSGEPDLWDLIRLFENCPERVNKAKSAVARPNARKFLGFSFAGEAAPWRRIAPQELARFTSRVRQLINPRRSVLEEVNSRLSVLEEVNSRLSVLEEVNSRLSRLERLMHGGKAVYLGDGRILTKASFGDVDIGYLVEANDRLLVPSFVITGIHEPEVTDFFIRTIKHTDHCLDVGANFGYYTCIMGRWAHAGMTIGIEPDMHVYELLRDNIYINSLQFSATALQAAVGAEPGTLTLHRRVTRSGNTSVARADYAALLGEPDPEAFEIGCTPIDQLLPRFAGRIDCIKIDVEGAEPLVFAGAKETVASNPHLKIVMEWSPGQIQAAGFDISHFTSDLQNAGLSGSVIQADGTEPISWDALLGHGYISGILLTREAE